MVETVVNIERNSQRTTATPSGSGFSWIKVNLGYFQSIPGMVKLVQLILGIICMICASPAYLEGTHIFLWVVVTAFIITMLWSFAYLLGVREGLNLAINWILSELVNIGLVTIFYLIGSIIQLANIGSFRWSRGSNIAAGIFGILNTVAYAFGSYLLYVAHRNGSME